MPRHSLSDFIPIVDPGDLNLSLPTLILVVRHSNAKYNYEYRFFGNDGMSRVEVFDHGVSVLNPKYTISGAGTCECQGFNYRQDCKHSRTVRRCWAEWLTAARVYFRLEQPLGVVGESTVNGPVFNAWLKKFYSDHAAYDPHDPEGFTVDLTI